MNFFTIATLALVIGMLFSLGRLFRRFRFHHRRKKNVTQAQKCGKLMQVVENKRNKIFLGSLPFQKCNKKFSVEYV
jgi:hypothetical protein